MLSQGKISIVLTGGLGNQLFKIGCALNYAKKYNKSLYISKSYFIPNNHQSSQKTFDTLTKIFPWLEINSQSINTICPSHQSLQTYEYREKSAQAFNYSELSDIIPKEIQVSEHNILLDGYYIHPNYLPQNFKTKFTLNPNNDMTKYGDFNNTYFIHIRLGDYVNHNLYTIQLEKYYNYCISQIIKTNPAAKFIICTNERGTNLDRYLSQFPLNCNYQLQDTADDELDTLYIMSKCQGGICSNSTLSWMGAYLQENPSPSTVFMPYPWINFIEGFTHDKTIGVYPEWCYIYNTITNTELVLRSEKKPVNCLDILRLYKSPYEKIRCGKANDGGYVICDIPDANYDLLISGGISNDITFEDDFLSRFALPQVKCVAFDGTIDRIPNSQNSNRISYIKKNLGNMETNTTTNLVSYMQDYNNIFMKIDIEGHEFRLIPELIKQNQLNKIKQLVIEIHTPADIHMFPDYFKGLQDIDNTFMFNMLKNINKTHTLVHFHANNGCKIQEINCVKIPHVFECTYIRNDLFTDNRKKELNKDKLPTNLDMRNVTYLPDINIDYYPFVNH